jgi:hypothetical protein
MAQGMWIAREGRDRDDGLSGGSSKKKARPWRVSASRARPCRTRGDSGIDVRAQARGSIDGGVPPPPFSSAAPPLLLPLGAVAAALDWNGENPRRKLGLRR